LSAAQDRSERDPLGRQRQLVPLFEPPLDPMALVRSVAAGVTPEAAAAGAAVPVPAYRFGFVFRKAQELADKLRQFGSDLLSVLERRDAEELSRLQGRQKGAVLAMTRAVKEAQVRAAEAAIAELTAAQAGAEQRVGHYERLIAQVRRRRRRRSWVSWPRRRRRISRRA
jgi:hypothetical protein